MENLQGGTLSLEHRYRVERRRGQSAFVTRYESLQLPFERPVWVEVYDALAEAGADPRVFERIKVSAHRAHGLDAPSILGLLDYGELDRGIPFVVSERVDGPTLEQYVDEQGPLPPSDAVAVARRVASALEVAHGMEIAHGTLHPGWITLPGGDPGEARVGHFEVGITLDELRRMDGAVVTPEVVRAFPPETFERDTIPPEELADDHRPTEEFTVAGDVWALGIVVYEALVGFHPFFDEDEPTDASEGIVRLQNEKPRPLADFGIETEISDVVRRALARSPGDRWDSPASLVDALARARGDDAAGAADSALDPTSPPEDAAERDLRAEAAGDTAPEASSESSDAPQLQPGGPASLLVTLTLLVLVGSNVGWFFYYMNVRAHRAQPTDRNPPVTTDAAPEKMVVESQPSEAAVYVEGREKPLGRTPLVLPDEIAESSSATLKLKKTGFVDQTIRIGRDASKRKLRIDLPNETSD